MHAQENSDADRLFGKMAEIIDKTEIFDCLKRVSRGIDRFDRELFLSAYHPDAIIDAGELVGTPDEVYEGGMTLHEAGQSSTLHHLTNHSCEVAGDVAYSEAYFIYAGRNRDGTNWVAGGRYVDRLERREAVWKIAFRFTVIEWSGMVPANEVPLFEHAPDRSMNGTPSRAKDDPSYLRPFVNRRPTFYPGNIRQMGDPRRG